ncbi:MAG TPA: hypothetical protein VLE89_06710 [Chlamydiales bacterium]|nr:hypothetical protein [Chlamydiales bacterium]
MIFFLLFAFSLTAEITRLPEEFFVVEQFLSVPTAFDISTEWETFATARKRILSLTTVFDLEDRHEQCIATAKAKFCKWGTVAEVRDPDAKKIGWIEEEYFRILPWAEFRVFNGEDELMAIAKMNVWGTKFELYPPDHPEIIYATISRPLIRFYRDHWKVKILNYSIFEENKIDPRLLVILALFQTDQDNRSRFRKEIENQIRLELEEGNT